MTKAELVGAIAKDAGIPKAAAEKALNSFTANVTKSLKKGTKVTLVGFGTFTVSKRAARKGRNPQTGKTISIPATKVPKFRAGKALKDAVKK
jgi:DNA-binding protein HU-beta